MTGKIKTLTDKGFGFITGDDNPDQDIFFHNTALQGISFDELAEGDAVTFDVEEAEKGPRAINVAKA
ncbi:MAG: cold shock domain-containing protein [Candidatus Uhrbacteria bacterium]|nr:cold shock domain-containing protein [Patescibacteria group bacterium]MBU1906595.1 cold shock domain-containing protein [Patescibacteria group bacterium]